MVAERQGSKHGELLDDHLLIAVAGPGATPETVDAVALLRVAGAYIALAAKVAETGGYLVSFQGVRVVDKCAAIDCTVDDPGVAQHLVREVGTFLGPRQDVPRGLRKFVEALDEAIGGLPTAYTATVHLGARVTQALQQRPKLGSSRPWESITLHAVPIRAGGVEPAVLFDSRFEPTNFILGCSREIAKRIGAILYDTIEIQAVVRRGATGRIEEGTLRGFREMDDVDPSKAWRQWYAENCQAWEDIDDLESAIGRTED